jgi:hypothetical protein
VPYLEAWEISQESTVSPSAEEKLNSPESRHDRKKGVLVNTPTLTWVYTRTFKERVRRARNSTTGIGSFSNQTGCCLSKSKIKNGYCNIFTEPTMKEKLKMRRWVNPYFK